MSANATVVLIGPGGVGKGTVARRLVELEPSLWLSRSWTTRAPRSGERGDEYVFVDRASFERAIAEDRFLEWAEYHGNLYGTPKPTPAPHQSVLLEIELQGARSVAELDPEALVILLAPPSLDELAARLRGRGDDPDHVTRRLGATEAELAEGRELAHHVVINADLDEAVNEILSILSRPRRLAGDQGESP